MLDRFLRAQEWKPALDFLSPAFFEVVPTLTIARLLTRMSRDFVSKARAAEAQADWQQKLASAELSLGDNLLEAALSPEEQKIRLGQTLLELYFSCVQHPGVVYLDLRAQSFRPDGTRWLWQPSPWLHTWDPIFRQSMHAIYSGFYDQRPSLYEEGLERLQLGHARELFREQFGDGQQDAVVFNLSQFRASFHKIFVSCREHKTTLHPDFFPLGLLLFGLYEHAAALGVPLSPRQAFQNSVKE